MTKSVEEIYKEARMKSMPDELTRLKWLKDQEENMEFGKRSISPTLMQYYSEAARCYVAECYLASTVMASFAIESELKSRLYGIPIPDELIGFASLIEDARKGHRITSGLADRLDHLRETMRNEITHPYSMFGLSFVGLKRRRGPKRRTPKEKPRPLYGPSDEDFKRFPDKKWPTSLTLKESAEEALVCLLLLSQEWSFEAPNSS